MSTVKRKQASDEQEDTPPDMTRNLKCAASHFGDLK